MADNEAKSRHVRLFVSLAVSLGLHTAVLSMTPGLPAWMTSAAQNAMPSAVTLAVHLPISGPQARKKETAPPSIKAAADPGAQAHEIEPPARSVLPATADTAAHSGPSGMFPWPWYYPARYLHRRPTPLKPIWPDYPESLKDQHGRVRILLLINEEGVVDQHRIEVSDPPGMFDAAVVAAFTTARYAPALIAGYQVKSQLLAEVSFEPGAPPRADFSIMGTARPIQLPASSLGREN